MEPIKYEDIILKGEIAARSYKNFARLHDRFYLPGIVGTAEAENIGWPGDWEGRTILALTLLGQSLHVEPAYLDQIVEGILSDVNRDGYRGDLIDFNSVNEQQLAGHGWLLRGLIEYYLWKKNEKVKSAIIRMIEGLYLPLAGQFSGYPARPEQRGIYEGKAVGDLTGETLNGWRISSDTGCAFIALDGLSQVYEVFRIPELGLLLGEMTDTFKKIDFIGIHMQTHATLTATRGMMRIYALNRQNDLLETVRTIYQLYRLEGMTENFANYNWFCKPEWTEPCGIIDSYMLAMYLWEHTGETSFLDEMHNIWYNGVCRGQRPNGGFGCDKCVTDGCVSVYENYYEANWCCTMRGGEGLSALSRFSMYKNNAHSFVFPFYLDAMITLRDEAVVLHESSSYPFDGKVQWEVQQGTKTPITFYLYLPVWAKHPEVTLNDAVLSFSNEDGFVTFTTFLHEGDVILFCFDIPIFKSNTIGRFHEGKGLKTLRHGTLILAADAEELSPEIDITSLTYKGGGAYEYEDRKLFPLKDAYLMDEKTLRRSKYRILFNSL